MKGQSFQTCFVIPIVTINGKAFGNAFLHIGCFSIYSKLPCSAQEHSQADHCKGYRNSTAAHVNQPDTCLTECKTYLVPPISKQTSPAARRKLCVSNIKPYGNHSREEYRRTVHYLRSIGQTSTRATALARPIQILSHTTVDPQCFRPRVIRGGRDVAQSSPRQNRQARAGA